MTSTPDSLLGIEIQAQNDNTGAWWANANQALTELAAGIARETAIATTGGDTPLTLLPYVADQSRSPIIRIASGQTLLSLVRITTARARLYFVTNESAAGAFAVQFGGNTSNLVTITRGCGAWVRVRSDSTTTFAGPLINLTTGAIDSASLASGAFLLGASNLSDLANAATARTNLGVAIGSNVQAYDADLTTWAGLTPSANAQSLVTAANYAAMRTLLGLVIGTDVQAYLGYTPLNAASNLSDLANAATARSNAGLTYASAAEQVTGSATDRVVAPGTQYKHKSAIKAWGRVAAGASSFTGTSYGVSGVSHTGTGLYSITMSSAMADANYSVLVTCTGQRVAYWQPTSATVFGVGVWNTTTNGLIDDAGFSFAVIGDQA